LRYADRSALACVAFAGAVGRPESAAHRAASAARAVRHWRQSPPRRPRPVLFACASLSHLRSYNRDEVTAGQPRLLRSLGTTGLNSRGASSAGSVASITRTPGTTSTVKRPPRKPHERKVAYADIGLEGRCGTHSRQARFSLTAAVSESSAPGAPPCTCSRMGYAKARKEKTTIKTTLDKVAPY
jgi:hypothetical protein